MDFISRRGSDPVGKETKLAQGLKRPGLTSNSNQIALKTCYGNPGFISNFSAVRLSWLVFSSSSNVHFFAADINYHRQSVLQIIGQT